MTAFSTFDPGNPRQPAIFCRIIAEISGGLNPCRGVYAHVAVAGALHLVGYLLISPTSLNRRPMNRLIE